MASQRKQRPELRLNFMEEDRPLDRILKLPQLTGTPRPCLSTHTREAEKPWEFLGERLCLRRCMKTTQMELALHSMLFCTSGGQDKNSSLLEVFTYRPLLDSQNVQLGWFFLFFVFFKGGLGIQTKKTTTLYKTTE